MLKYDYLIYIGRFQPFHCGHAYIVKEALKLASNVILVVGSDKKALDIRNPLSTQDRLNLIRVSIALSPEEQSRLYFAPQVDYTYNDDRWIAAIQSSVSTIIHQKFTPDPIKIGIVGYDKDHTTYYLKKFPQWEFVEIKAINSQNSTDFRKHLFELNYKMWKQYCVNDNVEALLDQWTNTDGFKLLMKEYEFVKDYKKQWEKSPYPPTFNTVDALVTQSGHLLLVKRGAMPGEGLWALPGGFVNNTETLEEAVIRELYEETRLDVPKPVLKGSLVERRTFDDPNRSVRGRTITETFYFRLNEAFDLPKVKGSDDAEKAFWVPFVEVVKNRDRFFEDHFSIIQCMVGL